MQCKRHKRLAKSTQGSKFRESGDRRACVRETYASPQWFTLFPVIYRSKITQNSFAFSLSTRSSLAISKAARDRETEKEGERKRERKRGDDDDGDDDDLRGASVRSPSPIPIALIVHALCDDGEKAVVTCFLQSSLNTAPTLGTAKSC